jgi:signal peptidase II
MNGIKTSDAENGKRARRAFVLWPLVFFGSLVVFDQWTKYLAFSTGFGNFLNKLRPIFAKEIFVNSAFAFSWPVPTWLIFPIYFFILAGLVIYLIRNYNKFNTRQAAAWLLIFAGAGSNIGERVINGYVKDFIYIWHGIFNFADIYILVGILMLLLPKKPAQL